MVGEAGTWGAGGAAQAVARVVYSANALANLERAFVFLAEQEESAAIAAVRAIRSAVEMLEHHPLIGRIISPPCESW